VALNTVNPNPGKIQNDWKPIQCENKVEIHTGIEILDYATR